MKTSRRWFALLPALLASLSLPCPAAPALTNAPARQVLSLNGPWHVIVDPYDNGYFNYRLQPYDAEPHPSGGYFLDRKPRNKSDLVEYDFDTSPVLNVPQDWNSQDPKLLYYEGSVWYRRTFDYTPRPGAGHLFLHFGGANYEADVYLNGEKLGRHTGGFTPFQFDVTGRVKPAGNSLVVRVNNRRRPDGVPTVNTDWWNYGGLTRDVALLETPPLFVHDYLVQLAPGAGDRLGGFVQLDSAEADQTVIVAVPELGVKTSTVTDAAGRAILDCPLPGLRRWSPADPKLYDVEITVGADRVADRIGFRSLEARGGRILLNGQPVFLRGVSLHEENPHKGGRATSADDDRLLLGWARELDCNFVRLAHYPHNEAMARVADELGLMLWEEIPVYWTIHWENPDTLANALAQMGELVTRDRNRASVVLWSLGNETPVSAPRTAFLAREAALVRQLDPTRLVSAAMEVRGDPADPHGKIVDDPLAEYVDVVSFNEYIGWYSGLPDDCAQVRWTVPGDKPVLVSEFGGDARQGFHADRLTRFSEEYQADLYAKTLPMLERVPRLQGMTPWILCDFRSPRRPLPGVQDGWNRKGLVGENGEKKQAFAVLHDYYARKAAEH